MPGVLGKMMLYTVRGSEEENTSEREKKGDVVSARTGVGGRRNKPEAAVRR